MKAVIGLGNPGAPYSRTRHNIGFDVVDGLAQRYGASLNTTKFQSVITTEMIGDHKVLLAKPQTFMNDSGQAVQAIKAYYDLAPDQMLIVYDDFHLDLGRVRFRPSGTAGGHNGIKSIISRVGGEIFDRMRIGIGEPPARMEIADYVLSKFRTEDAEEIEGRMPSYLDMIECWLKSEILECMNKFNGEVSE